MKIDNAYTDAIGTNWIEGQLIVFDNYKKYDYIQIEINLLAGENGHLGTAVANTNNWAGGKTWHFKAMGLTSGKASGYDSSSIEVSGW